MKIYRCINVCYRYLLFSRVKIINILLYYGRRRCNIPTDRMCAGVSFIFNFEIFSFLPQYCSLSFPPTV